MHRTGIVIARTSEIPVIASLIAYDVQDRDNPDSIWRGVAPQRSARLPDSIPGSDPPEPVFTTPYAIGTVLSLDEITVGTQSKITILGPNERQAFGSCDNPVGG